MPECHPQWITVAPWQSDADPIQPHPLAFRFDFETTSTEGVIEVAASNFYALWINGSRILDGPARSYPGDRIVDRLDVSRCLRSGKNHVAVLLLPPTGVTGYSCPTRNGLYGRITVGEQSFVTSRAWRARFAKWISSRAKLLSLAAGPQEHWDLQEEPEGWMNEPCEDWSAARELGPEGTPPWVNLRARTIAFPVACPLDTPLIWCGEDDRQPSRLDNPALDFATREIQENSTAANVFVFDLGSTRFFRPGIHVKSAAANTVLEFYYDTEFRDRPSVMRGFGTEKEGNCDTVKLAEGKTRWQSLRARGGRFVTVRIAGDSPCEIEPEMVALEYPFAPARKLDTPIDWLARAWEISAASIRSCATDGLVDTCARENALWTFDACVAGKAAYHTFGDAALWRHCLWLIGQGIDERGIPSAIVPTSPSFMVLFDQAFRWVITCADYVRLTGDDSLVVEVIEPVRRLLEAAEGAMTTDDLFVPPGYAWHWVDWAPLDRRAYSLPVNAVLLLAARAGTQLCVELDVARRIASRLKPALVRFREEDGLYRDHLPAPENVMPGNDFLATPPGECLERSFHGNALMATILDGEARQVIVAELVRWLGQEGNRSLTFGPGWVQILLQPLVEAGHGEAVLEFLRSRYGTGVELGVPTWGEGFPFTVHNSAHAWGAALNSLIAETGLGIRKQ